MSQDTERLLAGQGPPCGVVIAVRHAWEDGQPQQEGGVVRLQPARHGCDKVQQQLLPVV